MALVADNAGRPTTSSAVRTPTLAVADRPVKLNTADSTVPQPFSPQSSVPQPGFISVVNVPKFVDAYKPGSVTIGVSPQPSALQKSLPQPCSIKAESFQLACPQV